MMSHIVRFGCGVATVCLALTAAQVVAVETPAIETPAAETPAAELPAAELPAAESSSPNESISEAVRLAIIDNLAGAYQDSDDWGQKKEVFHGLKFERHGLDLKIKKRTKEVKHGLWKRYQVSLVEPERRLHVQVATLQPAGPGRVKFDVLMSAALRARRGSNNGVTVSSC